MKERSKFFFVAINFQATIKLTPLVVIRVAFLFVEVSASEISVKCLYARFFPCGFSLHEKSSGLQSSVDGNYLV